MFQGGGLFGSGASNSTSRSNTQASDTGQQLSGGTALNLGPAEIQSGKYGDAIQNTTVNVVSTDYGAINTAMGAFDSAVNLVAGAVSDTVNLALDVVGLGSTQSLEVVRAGESIAEMGSELAWRIAEQSERQAADAMAFAASEGAGNRVFLDGVNERLGDAYTSAVLAVSDAHDVAGGRVADAYTTANASMVGFMDTTFAQVADLHENSIYSLNQNAQAAQSASLKALDYVFESTKDGNERVADTTIKWAMAAVALIAIAPVVMRFAK